MSWYLYNVLNWWFIVAIIGLASLRGFSRFRTLPSSLRYLTLFAGFETFLELFSKALVRLFHLKSNLFLVPLDAFGTLGLLALAYGQALQSATIRRAIFWVLGIFSIYVLLDTLAGLGTVHYAPSVQVISDLLLLCLVGLYFQKLLNELRVKHLRHDPFFWMSVGTLIYALGDLQIALFSNYLLFYSSLELQLIIINVVRMFLLFTLYSSCCLALWMRPQK
jgi:hypothetical protein